MDIDEFKDYIQMEIKDCETLNSRGDLSDYGMFLLMFLKHILDLLD